MIERGSDRHSARLDEAMAHEVEGLVRGDGLTRAEEWRDPEPAGEDQPEPGYLLDPEGSAPPGMTPEQVVLRSELATRLERSVFPANAEALRAHLIAVNAPDRLVELLRGLPDGDRYETVGQVWQALGLGHEDERF